MDKDRLILAIGRLEHALSRIERGVARRGDSPPPAVVDEGLAARHRSLRGQVESAIARIDTLIERNGS